MGGQWRALSIAAFACALTLSGCALGSAPTPAEDKYAELDWSDLDEVPTESILEVCGFPATGELSEPEAGGLVYTYENGTTGRISFANGQCVLDTHFFTLLRPMLNDQELLYLYDYYRSTTSPCLAGFGYPSLSPPTRGAFVETGGDWSPWDSVFGAMMDSEEIIALSRNCPRYPTGHEWTRLQTFDP